MKIFIQRMSYLFWLIYKWKKKERKPTKHLMHVKYHIIPWIKYLWAINFFINKVHKALLYNFVQSFLFSYFLWKYNYQEKKQTKRQLPLDVFIALREELRFVDIIYIYIALEGSKFPQPPIHGTEYILHEHFSGGNFHFLSVVTPTATLFTCQNIVGFC